LTCVSSISNDSILFFRTVLLELGAPPAPSPLCPKALPTEDREPVEDEEGGPVVSFGMEEVEGREDDSNMSSAARCVRKESC